MPNTPKDEGFLDRWSRVKRESEPETEVVIAEPAPAEEELTDEELLEKLGLTDPSLLKEGDDVSGFMSPQVPDHLRRLALRFLWRSNPILANVDGLVDYGEDFTDAATVIENMQTIYQVGKGAAWKFKAEQEALAAAEAEESKLETVQRSTDDVVSEEINTDPAEVASEDQEQEPIQLAETETEDTHVVESTPSPRPRPMQFQFD